MNPTIDEFIDYCNNITNPGQVPVEQDFVQVRKIIKYNRSFVKLLFIICNEKLHAWNSEVRLNALALSLEASLVSREFRDLLFAALPKLLHLTLAPRAGEGECKDAEQGKQFFQLAPIVVSGLRSEEEGSFQERPSESIFGNDRRRYTTTSRVLSELENRSEEVPLNPVYWYYRALPPPQRAALELKGKFLQCIYTWDGQFGQYYPILRVVRCYLQNARRLKAIPRPASLSTVEQQDQAAPSEDSALLHYSQLYIEVMDKGLSDVLPALELTEHNLQLVKLPLRMGIRSIAQRVDRNRRSIRVTMRSDFQGVEDQRRDEQEWDTVSLNGECHENPTIEPVLLGPSRSVIHIVDDPKAKQVNLHPLAQHERPTIPAKQGAHVFVILGE